MQDVERSFEEGDKVTVWSRFEKKEGWVHNHIEEGWTFSGEPHPVADTAEGRLKQAKAWKGRKWKRTWGFIKNGKVVEVAKTREE
jgi:hypothetical protein